MGNEVKVQGFEAAVLQQLGDIHLSIAQTTKGTNDRIENLRTELSTKIKGVEIRLQRNDGKTEKIKKRVSDLEGELGDHVEEVSGLLEVPQDDGKPERGGLSSLVITFADIKGFLKVLPLIATLLGGSVAAVKGFGSSEESRVDVLDKISEDFEPSKNSPK